MEAAALVPVVILLVGGAGLRWMSTTLRHRSAWSWLSLSGCVLALWLLWGHRLSFLGWVESDPLSQFSSIMVLIGVAGALCLDRADDRTHGWTLLSAAGMVVMASTRNLLVVYVAWEIAFHGVSTFAGRGGFFTRFHCVSSGLAWGGIMLLFAATGSFDLAAMESALIDRGADGGYLPGTGLAFFVVGLVLQSVRPFWADRPSRSYPWAVTSLSAVFAVLLRVTSWLLVLDETGKAVLGALAAAALCVGCFMAMREEEPSVMLSFASIGQVGLLLVGVAVGGEAGRASVLFYLLAHTLMSLGAHGAAARRSRPAMGVFLLSLAGLPLTVGFWGRLGLIGAAVKGELLVLASVAFAHTLAGLYFYVKPLAALLADAGPDGPELHREGRIRSLYTGAAFLVVLALGVFPEPLLSLTRRVALEFF